MGRAQSIEQGLAAVAASAAEPVPVTERAEHVLRALRVVVPYDCAAIALWDAAAGHYRPLANADYPQRIYPRLHSPEYREEHVRLGMLAHRRPMRFRDLPCRGATVDTIAHLAWNEGFREGLGMALFTRDDRAVGYLTLNTTSRRYPTDRQRMAIGWLGPALAAVADAAGALAVRAGGRPTVALAADGPLLPLPGCPPSPLLTDDAPPVRLARRLVAGGGGPTSFLWRDRRHGTPVRIALAPCDERELPGYRALLSVEGGADAHGLTDRELEVLTLVARGWTNARIAERLVNSPRTVSTHVERVLDKLGATTRSEAAARAITERLLVWVGEDPPPPL